MQLHIPNNFAELDQAEFEYLLGNLNYQIVAYCGGEEYKLDRFGSRTIAIHQTSGNRFFINPRFFIKNGE